MDLLGDISQERRDQATPHRSRPRQDARRNAQAVLLAGLPAPLKVHMSMSPGKALHATRNEAVPLLDKFRARVAQLQKETFALWLASRDPRTPWYAKVFIAGVVAYAVSPIDLIPDFIPVLGLLDDLVLVPLGIVLAIRMIPPHVMAECRVRAHQVDIGVGSAGRIAAVVVVGIWLILAALCALWTYHAFAIDAAT